MNPLGGIDLMNEELRWMLASITNLLQAKDYYGAFVMCLITIEPLAAQRYPKLGNGERFRKFLYEERQPFCNVKNIYLPDANKCKQTPMKDPPKLEEFGKDFDRYKDALEAHYEDTQENMIPIETVLWKYCRNPIVHEGSRLAVGGGAVVTLDWTVPPGSLMLKVDQKAKNIIVIGAPYLLNLMYQIVSRNIPSN